MKTAPLALAACIVLPFTALLHPCQRRLLLPCLPTGILTYALIPEHARCETQTHRQLSRSVYMPCDSGYISSPVCTRQQQQHAARSRLPSYTVHAKVAAATVALAP